MILKWFLLFQSNYVLGIHYHNNTSFKEQVGLVKHAMLFKDHSYYDKVIIHHIWQGDTGSIWQFSWFIL